MALPTPQNGVWAVRGETAAEPGRSMSIDQQNGEMALLVYAFTPQGLPTFYMGSAALRADQAGNASLFKADLKEYEGGRSFGGPARAATAAGTAGEVTLRFFNSYEGTVQFPGESAKPIERMDIDTRLQQPDVETSDAFTGHLFDISGPPETFASPSFQLSLIRHSDGAQTRAQLHIADEPQAKKLTCIPDLVGSAGSGSAKAGDPAQDQWQCAHTDAQGSTIVLRLKLYGNEVLGELYYRKDTGGQADLATAQLRGLRHYYSSSDNQSGAKVHYAYSNANPQYVVPHSGLWVVQGELDGRPGRGMTVDVQGDRLIALVNGYDAGGRAVFYAGSSVYQPGAANALTLYSDEGGRYFGSGPRTARKSGVAGTMTLWFDTMHTGHVQFPDEMPERIIRMPLGPAHDPANLLGVWRFDSRGSESFTEVLSSVQAGRARSGDGLFQCGFVTPGSNEVLCEKSSSNPATGHKPYTFTFGWDTDMTTVYAEMLDPVYGTRQGASASRLAYPAPDQKGVYFSPGSPMRLSLER